jgi:hypothetical protein
MTALGFGGEAGEQSGVTFSFQLPQERGRLSRARVRLLADVCCQSWTVSVPGALDTVEPEKICDDDRPCRYSAPPTARTGP